ncbi:MAG: nucleoside triphosphate pyrophosphohydrolase [Paracoccaceae bacterium]
MTDNTGPNPLPTAESDELVNDTRGGLPRLMEIMRRLRDPETGCPWDIDQDFASIAPYTIEEAYEVADAIERGEMNDLRDELGDLLLQVIYHSQMAQEAGNFGFDDVVDAIARKMYSRHPHVFGTESREKSAEQQIADWEAIKAEERGNKPETSSVLDGIATGLPALTRAIKLQNRAARVGFDWPETAMVLDKIIEEARELVEAQNKFSKAEIEEEFGDLVFVMANLARHLDIEPETALRAANSKFTRRFNGVEAELLLRGKLPQESTLEEMDALWNEMKAREK